MGTFWLHIYKMENLINEMLHYSNQMSLISNLPIKEVYNKIANHFDRSRNRIWGSVKDFLDGLEERSIVLEIGCGNGKNMLYRKDLVFRGIDVSEEQVRICKEKKLTVGLGCMTAVDFMDYMFDHIICVATYHHLDNDLARCASLHEMWRLLQWGGTVLITVWAMEQPADGSFHFTARDEMVPWTSKDDGNTYLRYYHIYREGELEEEIRRLCPAFTWLKTGWELGNWYCVLRKDMA